MSEFAVSGAVGAGNVGVALFDGHGLEQIESFSLRDAFDDVDEHHVGEFFRRDPVGGGCAYVAGAYDGYLLTHFYPFCRGFSRIQTDKT